MLEDSTFSSSKLKHPISLIDCVPLRDVLSEHVIGEKNVFFDFFSLDIEGSEFTALQSIDYTKVEFGVILIEATNSNHKEYEHRNNVMIQSLLQSKGYNFLYKKNKSLWFINENFHTIYNHLYY